MKAMSGAMGAMGTMSTMATSTANETIGSYTLERVLARGSMGTVYVAHHTLTHARVALKVLRAEAMGDDQAEERFLREVRAAARIGHPGIVRVHDAGRSDHGVLYLAMELLEGETLERRFARLPGERLHNSDWLLRALDPLAAAHAQGIVHRDLKPANVFIAHSAGESPQVKLLDFGLARDTRDKSVTRTGIALGTPYYMSPEQATQPRDVDSASDVWAMGVMLYEILCGAMPFDGETLHAVVIRSSVTPHLPCQERAHDLDARLTALVDACLDKDPARRPADASVLRAQLAPLLQDERVRAALQNPVRITPRAHGADSQDAAAMPFASTAISLAPPELVARARPPAQRSGKALWASALLLLLLAIVGFSWLLQREPVQTEATPDTADQGRDAVQRARPRVERRRRASPPEERTPQAADAPVSVPVTPVAPGAPAASDTESDAKPEADLEAKPEATIEPPAAVPPFLLEEPPAPEHAPQAAPQPAPPSAAEPVGEDAPAQPNTQPSTPSNTKPSTPSNTEPNPERAPERGPQSAPNPPATPGERSQTTPAPDALPAADTSEALGDPPSRATQPALVTP